jgi:hypothetical protein
VTREYATDWATGDITDDVVFRDGKWWTRYHYETVRRDRERDRERGRRNRAVSRFLNAQSTSAGL